ncbi:excitatory amino acid transporter 2-like isoform X2 [Lineus longissimus]|uniref:excitatory amino acid transporter 2-like isoform X2 n=1 Tax=Lineus longissimus TaxID=88925 RepID=UPI00315CF2B6
MSQLLYEPSAKCSNVTWAPRRDRTGHWPKISRPVGGCHSLDWNARRNYDETSKNDGPSSPPVLCYISARVLLVCFAYMLLTSLLASVIGVAMGFAFSPGLKVKRTDPKDIIQTPRPLELCADFLRNVFPKNIITASLQMEQTNYSARPSHVHELMKYKISSINCNFTENRTQDTLQESNATLNESFACTPPSPAVTPSHNMRDIIAVDGLDALGVVFFACVIGLSASTPTRSGRPLRILFTSFAEVVQRASQWFYWISPVGLVSYTTACILSAPDVRSTIPSLGYFFLAVLAAAAIHQVVTLPVLYAGITRTNPFRLQLRLFKSWLLLLGTSSSDVVMSELMEACRKEGTDVRVYELGIPFVTALNRNGDALYITSACLFISQLHGIDHDPKTIVVIVLLAIFMTILSPRTSNGTILTLTAILSIVRLPTTYIPMLVSIDWLMSRLRTTCDGISSCYCVRFTFAACKDQLETYDIDQQIMYSIRSLNRLSRTLSGSESGMVTVV